jgi:hypothetical protein
MPLARGKIALRKEVPKKIKMKIMIKIRTKSRRGGSLQTCQAGVPGDG